MQAMRIHGPQTLAQALEIKAEHPEAVPLAGGTDLMVAINFRHTSPVAVLDLTAVQELREWAPDDGRVRLRRSWPPSEPRPAARWRGCRCDRSTS